MIVHAWPIKQVKALMGFTQISSATGKSEGWQYLPLEDFAYDVVSDAFFNI